MRVEKGGGGDIGFSTSRRRSRIRGQHYGLVDPIAG